MEIAYPIFWLILGVILAVVEALTVQLVVIWFALGAVAAIVPALLGSPMWIQFLVFVVVSTASLIFTRPLAKKFLQARKSHTNADQVIGQVGTVLQDVTEDGGRVQANGLDWAARSQSGQRILPGKKVRIHAIEGVTLLVSEVESL